MHLRLRIALIVPALLLAACSSPDEAVTALPDAFADGVPAPTGEVLLTVTTPDGDVDWDMSTLEQLPQLEMTLMEPFIDEVRTFNGPAFTDVMRASGVDVEVPGEIELIAIDDYRSTVPTDRKRMSGVIVATLDNGDRIALEDGGPIRLILPEDNEVSENLNSWIWSLRSGTVK